MGRNLSPGYGHVILVSGYLSLQLSIHHNMDVQYQAKKKNKNIRQQAPALARRCDISHWFPCGADERTEERTVTCLLKSLG